MSHKINKIHLQLSLCDKSNIAYLLSQSAYIEWMDNEEHALELFHESLEIYLGKE